MNMELKAVLNFGGLSQGCYVPEEFYSLCDLLSPQKQRNPDIKYVTNVWFFGRFSLNSRHPKLKISSELKAQTIFSPKLQFEKNFDKEKTRIVPRLVPWLHLQATQADGLCLG